MKRFLICLIMLLGFSINTFAKNIGESYTFMYVLASSTSAHVSGQTINIKIMKVSNAYWYDFGDNSFKAAGWSVKIGTMTENSTDGYYYYSFTPPISETSAEQYVFFARNSNSAYADYQSESVDYTTALSATDVWSSVNRSLTDKQGFFISGTKTTLDSLNDVSLASISALSLSSDDLTAISAAVLDPPAANHNIPLSIGAKINASGSSGDPLQNYSIGYSTGTVGYEIHQTFRSRGR